MGARGLARTLYRSARLLPDAVGDFVQMARSTAITRGSTSRGRSEGVIIARYHSLEKGLSLPHPRPDFGTAAVDEVLGLCETHWERYRDRRGLGDALNAVSEFLDFRRRSGTQLLEAEQRLATLVAETGLEAGSGAGGVRSVRAVDQLSQGLAMEALLSRSSIRRFGTSPVDRDLILAAVEVAMAAPAVCNRRGGRVHLVADPEMIGELLALQGGAKGFEAGVQAVALLTNDLEVYNGVGERNQVYIDGGLFAMNFLNGLHLQGLAACSLNWSKVRRVDRQLRALIDLPLNEVVLFLVAIGSWPASDEVDVAYSPRPSASERLVVHLPTTVQKPTHRESNGDL